MSNTCIIIEGELRAGRRCGPNIRKYVIDALGADLIICAQNTDEFNTETHAGYYGPAAHFHAYSNPVPDFSDIFDSLRTELKCDFDWRETLRLNGDNWRRGFDGPGVCIRRMYNRHLIYQQLKNADYSQYILTRSDMYFLDDFPLNRCADPHTLYIGPAGNSGGVNNDLLVFGAPIREAVLNYLTLFLDGTLARAGNPPDSNGLTEPGLFQRICDLQKINRSTLPHTWFVTADAGLGLCDRDAVLFRRHPSGLLYKNRRDFEEAFRNAGIPL